MTKIVLERKNCYKIVVDGKTYQERCAFCKELRTPGAGYAMDYWCIHPEMLEMEGKPYLTMGYVEWSSDEKPIPAHCPLIPLPEGI